MKSATRSYDNSLRTEQAAATRERIVDAAVEVLSQGADKLSIPAVAAQASVSVPTVYRHFASKTALVDAVYDRYAERIDVQWQEGDMPRDLEEFLGRVPGVFARHESVPPALRSVMSGPEGVKARRQHMPERLARIDDLLAGAALSDDDRDRARELLLVLTSSAVLRAFRDYLGLAPDQAADRVTWAIRRLVTPAPHNATSRATRKATSKRRRQ